MMVEIQKGKIVGSINFLYDLSLVRKQSRMRRKFINLLDEKNKAVLDEREEILKEHSEKDADGEPIIKNDHYQVKDQKALAEDLKELNDEMIVIEGGDNREMIRTMKDILRKFEEEEYEGEASEIYDYLCDQFKIDEEEENKNEEENAE
ncbi:hypothetical protein [Oceanobacillus sp. J11TS1]|uniref:hypothetical protein n=1 Tax=Oceanobacillus sp. J11TS1 TaxID=2807191 RepID=UPI001B2CF950|nr:hypothetical protein [Oceanobacillus sp. J11TS1]GIO22422.1 hypothetical protein J11TS1_10030 [Oceanobacillus sp. J11TS1]